MSVAAREGRVGMSLGTELSNVEISCVDEVLDKGVQTCALCTVHFFTKFVISMHHAFFTE